MRAELSMHTRIDHVDEDEIKLCEISKHPFGIIVIYIFTALGMGVGLGLAYFLIPSIVEDTDFAFGIANVFAGIVMSISLVVMVVATIVYRQNRLVVTDRNITQTLQYGLFSRKVSQLNLVNVEDVTSEQDGVLPTIFDYGILKVETAGEQVNFVFSFCPRPGFYAKIILEAREKMLGQHDDQLRPEVKIEE